MPRYIAQAGTSVVACATYQEAASWLALRPEHPSRKDIRAVYAPGEGGEPDWNDRRDPRVRDEERYEHDAERDF